MKQEPLETDHRKAVLMNSRQKDAVAKVTMDSNSDICLLEGRSIVDTVASHATHVAPLHQDFHNGILVLWEDLCKSISVLHQLIYILHTFQGDDSFLCLSTEHMVSARQQASQNHLKYHHLT